VVTSTNPAQKYKYNGKELQDELGLNMYAMDFRNYDPAIARFTSIDPVTHHKQSPFVAFYNNPVYWADPTGATGEHYNWDTGKYENDKGKEVTFAQALASQGLNEDGSEKSNEEDKKDSATSQIGLSPESFDFQKTTDNWQAAGVTGLSLTVQNSKRQTKTVDFELEVGLPLKLKDGTIISERVAQLASAQAANETAASIGTLAAISNGNFYNAPALVKQAFAKLMQRNLNKAITERLSLPENTKIGSRVNSPIQSYIITKPAVWNNVSAYEAIKVWMKSWF
jgi:RHS repeat-associated protein